MIAPAAKRLAGGTLNDAVFYISQVITGVSSNYMTACRFRHIFDGDLDFVVVVVVVILYSVVLFHSNDTKHTHTHFHDASLLLYKHIKYRVFCKRRSVYKMCVFLCSVLRERIYERSQTHTPTCRHTNTRTYTKGGNIRARAHATTANMHTLENRRRDAH